MKTTKKVRAKAESRTNVKKKKVGTNVPLMPNKKTGGKTTSHKVPSSKTQAKVTRKTVPPAMVPAKTKEPKSAAAKTKPDKRKLRKLSGAEYDAFVVQAAQAENVMPNELMTVERRQAIPDSQRAFPSTEVTERREKIQRRRQIDPTTCERDYSQEEIEFMNALDEYKRNSGRMFPTCSEILEVFRSLGYMKQLSAASVEMASYQESDGVDITAMEISTLDRSEENGGEVNHHDVWEIDVHDFPHAEPTSAKCVVVMS